VSLLPKFSFDSVLPLTYANRECYTSTPIPFSLREAAV
jgi:hypothetical protein